jgi:hypothetical protein
MTRDEAIEKARAVANAFPLSACERLVDTFSALGLLELEEPKNPENLMCAVLSAYVHNIDAAAILDELDRAGLKVVRA